MIKNKTAKIRAIGNSSGMTLPADILAKLNVGNGDTVFFTETPNGIEISAFDPKFSKVMEISGEIRKRRRNMFRKLAE